MAKTKFVTIATFLTPEPAYLARSQLDAEGIAAFLENESSVGMMGVLSNAVGGVKLQVEQADVERATEILELFDEPRPSRSKHSADNWKCVHCGTKVEPAFDVCWSCGASRDGTVDPSFHAEESAEEVDASGSETRSTQSEGVRDSRSPPLPSREDPNPYASPKSRSKKSRKAKRKPLEPEESSGESPEDLAARAFKAAIIGFFACPGLLHIYSMYVLLCIGVPTGLSGRARSQYIVALAINVFVALLLAMVFFGRGWIPTIFNSPPW